MARNNKGVSQGIIEVRLGDADELREPIAESGVACAWDLIAQCNAARQEEITRKPARAAFAVLPNVLKNISHLEPLTE